MVSSRVRGVTNMTNICSQLAECLYATFCNQMIVHHHELKCAKNLEFCLQGQEHSVGLNNQNMAISIISFISSKPMSILQPNSIWW